MIEQLDHGTVEALGRDAVCCVFDYSRARDFDQEVITLFGVLRSLGADELIGVVMADEDNTVYVAVDRGETAVLVPDEARRQLFDEPDGRELIALARSIVRERPARTTRDVRFRRRGPKKPTLVLLPPAAASR